MRLYNLLEPSVRAYILVTASRYTTITATIPFYTPLLPATEQARRRVQNIQNF